ncbi:MAG: hypothetical protein GXP48_09175, partial [Acidobacteria bacterium]|nr:hypothetical protein [Acidobacteriota bacterium]
KMSEQLEKAQQRSVDALTNRLDFINESLAKLVEEVRSAIAEATPADPEELFPVGELVELANAARDLHARAEERASALVGRIEELEQQLAAAQTEVHRPGALPLDMLRRLDAARSQSELLKELLPLLVSYVGRAAVLVIREGTVSAWSGIGFADVEDLKAWQAEVSASEVLERFASLGGVVTFVPTTDPVFSRWLSGQAQPSEAWLIPVNLRGRIVGAMYVDRLEEGPWNPEAAQGLVALACWLIDTLGFRTTVPSPMLAKPVAAVAQGTPEAAAEPEEPVEAEAFEQTPTTGYAPVEGEAAPSAGEVEAGEAAPDIEPPVAAETAGIQTAVEEEEPALVEEEAVPDQAPPGREEIVAPAEPSGTPGYAEQPPAVEIPAKETETRSWEEAREIEESPAPEIGVPPEVQPVAPPAVETFQAEAVGGQVEELSPEERAEHEEAERFARLLVSEIKLYNPDEVERGKEAKDLYQRLKEDIDRSREMYDTRVSEAIRSSRDYFREQLVRILADGDEEALGM